MCSGTYQTNHLDSSALTAGASRYRAMTVFHQLRLPAGTQRETRKRALCLDLKFVCRGRWAKSEIMDGLSSGDTAVSKDMDSHSLANPMLDEQFSDSSSRRGDPCRKPMNNKLEQNQEEIGGVQEV